MKGGMVPREMVTCRQVRMSDSVFGFLDSSRALKLCRVSDVTQILERVEHGDGKAAEELLPLVYEELRKLAAHKMAQESPGQTLQATALVHEARKIKPAFTTGRISLALPPRPCAA